MRQKLLRITCALLCLIGGAVVSSSQAAAWCVRGVAANDTLRLRAGPSVRYRAIGGIPATACGIRVIGPCYRPWCRVAHRGRVGWSNANYLSRKRSIARSRRSTRPRRRTPPQRARTVEPARDERQSASAQPRRETTQTRQTVPKPALATATAPAPAAQKTTAGVGAGASPPVRTRPSPTVSPAIRSEKSTTGTKPVTRTLPTAATNRTVPPSRSAPAAKAKLDEAKPAASSTPKPATVAAVREVCVAGIPEGDTLKVRAGPGFTHALRYGYQPKTCGVKITGACKNGWCPVDFRGYKGWAQKKNLQ